MKTILQKQQAQALLKSVGKVSPVYLLHTPKGKRLLQLPQLTGMAELVSPIGEQSRAEYSPVDTVIKNL